MTGYRNVTWDIGQHVRWNTGQNTGLHMDILQNGTPELIQVGKSKVTLWDGTHGGM